MEQQIHTIFGAGQVGQKLADELLTRGHQVRLVRRSAAGPARPGLTWLRGDITDQSFAREAARGAAVVYHCANPATYYNWAEILPPIHAAILDAAARAGARLVVLDNLYMYGMPAEQPFDEDAPIAPRSDKGELRARLATELQEAHDRGDVRATTGRASDYFGPATPNAAIFRDRFFERLFAGKPVELFGDPEQPHSYSYTPDVARGLAILGSRDEALGKVWHLPVASQVSTAELVRRFAAAAGVDPRWRTLPRWLFKTVGLVSPTIRSVGEMLYQWEGPFVVDDRRFRTTFGDEPTDLDRAVADTVESYRGVTAAAA